VYSIGHVHGEYVIINAAACFELDNSLNEICSHDDKIIIL